jgi:peroxiredoxin
LRRWEELRPELDAWGVQLVTVCTDSPEQIRAGMGKHGARAVMLSDRDLAVTRLYRLENTARGITPPGLVGLPIPTTVLADADHVVRWIDQAADYQVRSAPERVRDALRAALGEPLHSGLAGSPESRVTSSSPAPPR